MIEIKDLEKTYAGGSRALDHIDLELHPGVHMASPQN